MRRHSIDVMRAVTMVLMIFVNDFWTLEGVPEWMQHMPADRDGLGFSDIIFPAFLFIVGLSIPYAIDKRLSTQGKGATLRHIILRSLALIIMGVFLVNLESIYTPAMIVPKQVWQISIVLAFLLTWNNYHLGGLTMRTQKILIGTGILLMVILAIIYRGGAADDVQYMQRHWWGILGLIGWAYLYCALIYFFLPDRLIVIGAFGLFFLFLNLGNFMEWWAPLELFKIGVWMPDYGAFSAFVMVGVIASVFQRTFSVSNDKVMITGLVGIGCFLFLYGLLLRSSFGISKIKATPSWIGICSAISIWSYAFFYWLIDCKKIKKWAQLIRPAGSSTLTCYLVPYIYYALWSFWSVSLPLFLRTGLLGLIKSFLFALLIVLITGWLQKHKISLKI